MLALTSALFDLDHIDELRSLCVLDHVLSLLAMCQGYTRLSLELPTGPHGFHSTPLASTDSARIPHRNFPTLIRSIQPCGEWLPIVLEYLRPLSLSFIVLPFTCVCLKAAFLPPHGL